MRRAIGMAAVLLFVGATTAMAQGIDGTAHDFSADTWNGTGEICVVCHAPHNNRTTDNMAADVLWNRDITESVFTVYSSVTMDATPGTPAGTSKFCLSCHDGTIGLESFGGTSGTTTNPITTGPALLGVDLSNDHPVSVAYTDPGLNPTTTVTLLGGTIADDYLRGGNVECSSCHAVHNEGGVANFLWVSNAGSQLCQDCHGK